MDPNGDGDPSDGIDGWRLDVAPDIGIAFWREWHALVKEINPQAVTVGEIWMPADRWIEAGCFDGQMNYPLAMALVDFLRGNRDAGWLADRCRTLLGDLDDHDLAQMNLMTSHDTERLASMLANPGTEYDPGRGLLRTPESYDAGRPAAEAYDLVVLAYAILAVLPGSPMVFQGDELGMSGGDDPECRKPVPWPDLGAYASADDAPDEAMVERLAAWLRLRSDPVVGAVLRLGAVEFFETGEPDLFAVGRTWEGRSALLVANRSGRDLDAAGVLAAGGFAASGGTMIPARSARLWLDGEPVR
jgi:glycosidase